MGHGPIFGYSTATLGLGDASVGTEVMWRSGATMIGPEFSYGWKENLQISITAPFHVDHGEHPTGRFIALMPGDPSVEVSFWRGGSFTHPLASPRETKPLFTLERLP
jgi:hypothetical protein